ncbi:MULTISPECIES: preprotein translocase subunit SecG [Hydrogenophaga]|uniref:Protein-export membrane protein SecG n=1 Tax=Hydrogenophaga electricum TaxID=1230953 RepID=A0ABQ6BYJ5_9BURK|nr:MULTISPECIES: preprotein translocase subunit SecG [Hydrogenophaga]GLS12589.1 hypothetical protein GCM10007935_00150 [Hydrogenophaga electricum]
MNILLTILQAVQILTAIGMIGLILMQHGKGADAGAAFGGGGSGSASLFGASGGANFLSRTTAVLATVFLASTLALAYFGNLRTTAAPSGSVLEGVMAPAPATSQPAAQPGTTEVPAGDAAPAGAAQIPGQ